jgi:hypothetical protein
VEVVEESPARRKLRLYMKDIGWEEIINLLYRAPPNPDRVTAPLMERQRGARDQPKPQRGRPPKDFSGADIEASQR